MQQRERTRLAPLSCKVCRPPAVVTQNSEVSQPFITRRGRVGRTPSFAFDRYRLEIPDPHPLDGFTPHLQQFIIHWRFEAQCLLYVARALTCVYVFPVILRIKSINRLVGVKETRLCFTASRLTLGRTQLPIR
jgi:hypothetical protein